MFRNTVTKITLIIAAMLLAAGLIPFGQVSAAMQGELSGAGSMPVYEKSITEGLSGRVVVRVLYGASGDIYAITLDTSDEMAYLNKYSSAGQLVFSRLLDLSGSFTPAVSIGRDDSIYINTSAGIDKFDSSAVKLATLTPDLDDYGGMSVLLVMDDGTMYATTESGDGSYIVRINQHGEVVKTVKVPVTEGDFSTSITALDVKGGQLYGLSSSGTYDETRLSFVGISKDTLEIDTVVQLPVTNMMSFSLVVENDNFYVASFSPDDTGGDVGCGRRAYSIFMTKYSTSGEKMGELASGTIETDGIVCPYLYNGIASDGQGDIYVGSGVFHDDGSVGSPRIVKYSTPKNQASFTPNHKTAKTDLKLPAGVNITKAVTNTAAELNAPTDQDKAYPLGLVNFTAEVQVGATIPVELYFETDLQPGQVVARKYNSVTKAYGDIPGAVIAQVVVDGKPNLKLTYSITDGGELDEDGAVNGVIVDPVGLAVVGGASSGGNTPGVTGPVVPGVPNTGFVRQSAAVFGQFYTKSQHSRSGAILAVTGVMGLFAVGLVAMRRIGR